MTEDSHPDFPTAYADDIPGRDHPLIGHWTWPDRQLVERLELPPPKSKKHAEARERIVAEAIWLARVNPSRWTSYSRRPEFYAKNQRYRGRPLTFATVVTTVDELVEAGYFDHEKATPGQRGTQSRFRASARLMAIADAQSQPLPKYEPRETIVLRDVDKSLLDYVDSEQTTRMRSRLAEINEGIAASQISYGGIKLGTGGVLILPEQKLPIRNSLHRVFNRGQFDLGGRFYGATWQNIPKRFRPQIIIDGEPTVEHDHSRLHPRLLYALAGHRLDFDFDPYDVPGFERGLAKKALNTLINAETESAALRSIAREIGGQGAYARARELILALKVRNEPIGHLFGSGLGLRLQRVDSDMAEAVELYLFRKGIVALPVHDSAIVQAKHGGILVETMNKALEEALEVIGAKDAISGYRENVPQYGDRFFIGSDRPFPFFLPPDGLLSGRDPSLEGPLAYRDSLAFDGSLALDGFASVVLPAGRVNSGCVVVCRVSPASALSVRTLGVFLADGSFVPNPDAGVTWSVGPVLRADVGAAVPGLVSPASVGRWS